ncbi:hypothetical protein B0A49_01123 [Cryomyces minteri]|uniref:BRCT domain-containing protein n=1 Tax=Cryomyces minteri TaxID=331657 RepID=A0A4U0XST5_9PEZI|nr:hypothetical protein B0A49_01123 [Cryomyces minteri]
MPPQRAQPANPTAAAKPTSSVFDPWKSSSTGHQRAENRLSGSTSWRESRSLKLGEQFRSGAGGGPRLCDTVGAGSESFGKDGRKENGGWGKGASGLREAGQRSILEGFGASKPGVKSTDNNKTSSPSVPEIRTEYTSQGQNTTVSCVSLQSEAVSTPLRSEPQIFTGLCVYINGSTAPTISDHKLKHLLSTHGAKMSIALGRRSVTHVVLGNPNGHASGPGAGGGLSGSKIQREIARVGGRGIKFVGIEWVLESVKAGKRLPEARFENLRLAPKGQGSVLSIFEMRKGAGECEKGTAGGET